MNIKKKKWQIAPWTILKDIAGKANNKTRHWLRTGRLKKEAD